MKQFEVASYFLETITTVMLSVRFRRCVLQHCRRAHLFISFAMCLCSCHVQDPNITTVWNVELDCAEARSLKAASLSVLCKKIYKQLQCITCHKMLRLCYLVKGAKGDAPQSWSKFHLLSHMTCLPAPLNLLYLANPVKPVGELVMDLELHLGGVV